YLVPSLRDWLTRKQKESRRGRTELLLADRAAIWNGRPENRQLPSLPQWLSIFWWTRKKRWTEPQRKMMRKATRHHAGRGVLVTALVVTVALVSWSIRNSVVEKGRADPAAVLEEKLLIADTDRMPVNN